MSAPVYTLESGFDEAQGRRDTMEDTHCVINDAKNHPDLAIADTSYKAVAFYGVFDGHGGVRCSFLASRAAVEQTAPVPFRLGLLP
jgi:serine/threonine protein phosphatase PrpC